MLWLWLRCLALLLCSSALSAHAAVTLTAGARYSFESYDLPGSYLRHAGFGLYVSPVASGSTTLEKQDGSFTARAGLYGSGCWSFESVNYPGYYLRHQGFILKLHVNSSATLYKQDATFCLRDGLADSAGLSLESVNYAGYYIRHLPDLSVGLAVNDGSGSFNGRATFYAREPWQPDGSLHHLQVTTPGSTGLTCTPSSFTVTACADSSCSSPYTAGLSGNLALTGAGMTINYPSGAGFSMAPGASQATVSAQITTTGSVVVGVSGLSAPPSSGSVPYCGLGSSASSGSSCSYAVASAGLLFDVADHVAETAQTLSISAVKTSASATRCVPAFASVSKSLTLSCAYANPASGTLPVRVAGTALNASANSAAACDGPGRAVTLAFDSTGTASTTLQYADVGRLTLAASYTGTGSEAGLGLSGSDSFVAAPAGFVFSAISSAPIRAGSAFAATVTARNAAGTSTPNFGREASAEGVLLAFTRSQPTGTGASDGSFSGSLGSFSAGSASATNLVWSEVGLGDLTATLASASYLGSGLGATGTTGSAGAIGRFIPHHFDVLVTPACGSFSYAEQPFSVRLTAMNGLATPSPTLNYDGSSATAPSFARAVNLSDAAALGLGSFGSTGTVAASAFVAGVATTLTPAYSFTAKLTPAQTLAVRATDADAVSSLGHAEGSTALRSGRLRLSNAFGSERAALQLTVQAQYWSGNAWVPNSADSCTSLPAAAIVRSGYLDGKGTATAAWSTSAAAVTVSGGSGPLTLSAPSPMTTGSVDLALNLGATATDRSCLAAHPASTGAGVPWLRSQQGSCAATWDRDPAARASFGIYSPETRKTVHVRELF